MWGGTVWSLWVQGKLLGVNWRNIVARELTYIDQGRVLCETPYRLILTAGIIRLLWPGAPWWLLVSAAPVVLVVLAIAGRVHRSHGWLCHQTSVSFTEGLSPLSVISAEWAYRMLCKLGIPATGISPRPRPEIVQALAEVTERG